MKIEVIKSDIYCIRYLWSPVKNENFLILNPQCRWWQPWPQWILMAINLQQLLQGEHSNLMKKLSAMVRRPQTIRARMDNSGSGNMRELPQHPTGHPKF